MTHTWPVACEEPYKQPVSRDQSGSEPYFRYLKAPFRPTWNLITAIPVSQYSQFFQKGWWRIVGDPAGVAELKFVPYGPDGATPLRSVLRDASEKQDAEIIRAFRNRHTVEWSM